MASPLLYVHRDTLACALGRCVPCLYKVWPGGRRGLPPNVRPELCPRARDAAAARRADARGAVGLYRRGERVLTVGDGAFTFSLALSRLLARSRAAAAADAADAGAERAPARAPMVFTSHESRESDHHKRVAIAAKPRPHGATHRRHTVACVCCRRLLLAVTMHGALRLATHGATEAAVWLVHG